MDIGHLNCYSLLALPKLHHFQEGIQSGIREGVALHFEKSQFRPISLDNVGESPIDKFVVWKAKNIQIRPVALGKMFRSFNIDDVASQFKLSHLRPLWNEQVLDAYSIQFVGLEADIS